MAWFTYPIQQMESKNAAREIWQKCKHKSSDQTFFLLLKFEFFLLRENCKIIFELISMFISKIKYIIPAHIENNNCHCDIETNRINCCQWFPSECHSSCESKIRNEELLLFAKAMRHVLEFTWWWSSDGHYG